jgi:L-alanine-DL-glutamate epimerase-like enolase superfamily enzyme
MRITRIETLKADGGWRNFSFLKLSTDEGLVGWSEYNEDFGATNATSDLIHRFADIAVGMDPREVGKIAVSLRAITRMSIGGVNHEAIAAIENACLDVKAKALGVPRGKVRILSGTTSRLKQVAVDGDPARLGDALRKATAGEAG